MRAAESRQNGAEQSQYERMTRTSIPKLIARLSVPTILSMLVTNIYNLVDTAFVGQLGTSQSAAVGVIFGYMSVIQAIGFMFGMGAGSIMARKLGARDPEAASRTASTAVIFSVGTGLLLSLITLPLKDQVVRFLGSTETIVAGMMTMAKVNGIILARIQQIKLLAASKASWTKRS